MAINRVRQRVVLGGHAVADAVVRRRYESGWRNFTGVYRPLVDEWALYDNAGSQPQLLEEGGIAERRHTRG